MSQSSCEIIADIKNLEVCSETENFSSQFSDIAEKVTKLNVEDDPSPSAGGESSSSEASSSSSSDSSSPSDEVEQPTKRKRKRKRKRRKKVTVAAYTSPEPFKSRYKKVKLMEPAVLPKLHIRFDELGVPDVKTSEYNLKPRIIRCLERNLLVHEDIRAMVEALAVSPQCCAQESPPDDLIVSLKPRIIRAIIIS